MKDKNNNIWYVIVGVLLIILIFIIVNKIINNFSGMLEKSDILNFFGNLLVVIITVALGIITYEQTKHIQEESSKENEYLRKTNQEANETNKELVNIIKRNAELEEQKNMPCVNVKLSTGSTINIDNNNEIKLELENVGNTIIKYIDIEEIPEEVVIRGIYDAVYDSVKSVLENFSKSIGKLFTEHTKKTDFLKLFNHEIDMVGIHETFNINVSPKKIEAHTDENLYVIALNMKIENIFGKRYNEKVIILLQENESQLMSYKIKGKYIDIETDK